MKNFIIAGMALVVFAFNGNAQDKKTIKEGEFTTVEVTTLATEINSIAVEIKVTNKETNVTLPSFIHKFTSDSKTNIINDLKKIPKSVNGLATIEIDGQVVYKRVFKEGVFEDAIVYEFIGTSVLGKEYPCSIKGNLMCVRDKIVAMNPVEYGFCLVGAPACLSEMYLSCVWDNCIKKE